MKSRENYVLSPLKIGDALLTLFDDQSPQVIFDVGACEGLDSIRYSRLFPNARVFAFEPVPKNVARISDNLERFDARSISVITKAFAKENGTAEFFLSDGCPKGMEKMQEDWEFGNKSSSLMPPNLDEINKHWPWLEFNESIQVETIRMDHFCHDQGIQPDFITMDVQGAEMEVLAGAKETLKNVTALWVEVSFAEIYQGQQLADNVNQFMSDAGFVERIKLIEGIQADILYVAKRDAAKIPDELTETIAPSQRSKTAETLTSRLVHWLQNRRRNRVGY